MTRDYWGEPYDGARHPEKPDPAAHDDIHPVAWRERLPEKVDIASIVVFVVGFAVFFALGMAIAASLT